MCPAHLPTPVRSPYPYAALVTVDPASVSDCGVAVRLLGALADKPQRGKLPWPGFTYEGSVWNTRFHDDLSCYLAKHLERGAKVRVVCAGTMFGNRTIARSLGRCGGAVESLLVALNLYEPKDLAYVSDAAWRKSTFPLDTPKDRDALKEAAVALVELLYGERVGDNLAEAVLLSDHVVLTARALWAGKKEAV